ncbi:UDP-glycosyltransferase 73C3 [Trifolium repens]|nr:UDP-glycosyltransferase 73C3 [Trifolium repens]
MAKYTQFLQLSVSAYWVYFAIRKWITSQSTPRVEETEMTHATPNAETSIPTATTAATTTHNRLVHVIHERVESMPTLFLVPDFSYTIEFTKAQLPEAIDQFKESELSAQGILVNTFEELEKNYVRGYENIAEKFLVSSKACSIIYVCFGGLSFIHASQLKELALGLEA